jgi:hypothetical protein
MPLWAAVGAVGQRILPRRHQYRLAEYVRPAISDRCSRIPSYGWFTEILISRWTLSATSGFGVSSTWRSDSGAATARFVIFGPDVVNGQEPYLCWR